MLAGRPKSVVYPRCPVPMEGRLAIVTNAGRDAVDAAARETNAVCLRTAKACGSDAPIVGVKSVRRSAGDGVKKRGHRGEREVSRKTIARGMPGRSGVTVVTMLVCLFYFAYEAAGASSARHSLRPLFSERRNSCTARANSRRGNAKVCLMNANAPDSHSSSPGLPPSPKPLRGREIACPVEALAQTGPGDPVFQRRQ